jgi:hypothetical protein
MTNVGIIEDINIFVVKILDPLRNLHPDILLFNTPYTSFRDCSIPMLGKERKRTHCAIQDPSTSELQICRPLGQGQIAQAILDFLPSAKGGGIKSVVLVRYFLPEIEEGK